MAQWTHRCPTPLWFESLQPTHMLSQPRAVSISLWEQSEPMEVMLDVRGRLGIEATVMQRREWKKGKKPPKKTGNASKTATANLKMQYLPCCLWSTVTHLLSSQVLGEYEFSVVKPCKKFVKKKHPSRELCKVYLEENKPQNKPEASTFSLTFP